MNTNNFINGSIWVIKNLIKLSFVLIALLFKIVIGIMFSVK